MEGFRSAFRRIKVRFDEGRPERDELVCKQGFYDGCPVLKLQKASWTNDRMDHVPNKTGVFFSVWVDGNVASTNRANYNIHALKLRQLAGYSITSRAFASDFRTAFASMRESWPNVSLDYGPLTLMQGWIDIDRARFEDEVLLLMERFEHVSPVIDRLLAERQVAGRHHTPTSGMEGR